MLNHKEQFKHGKYVEVKLGRLSAKIISNGQFGQRGLLRALGNFARVGWQPPGPGHRRSPADTRPGAARWSVTWGQLSHSAPGDTERGHLVGHGAVGGRLRRLRGDDAHHARGPGQ